MSKAAVKKLHWRSKVQESFVPLGGASGELGVSIGGGADYGEFPFVTSVQGGGTNVGDVILEIGGTPVLGMTLGDVRGVLNSCPHPIRIKTVSPGSTLCKDLRLYLSKCFTPGSMDSQLQQVIRENLYLRAVPCTTRLPRDGEISGVDYNFVSVEEFFSLEESGALLESGKFKGNYYGTPRPVHIGPESPPITYQEHRNLLRNFRTRSKSLSNLEKTGEEGENSEEDSGLSGGSLGVSSGAPPGLSPSQSRDSSGGDGSTMENGGAGLPENWEMAFSDSGEPYYIDHTSRTTSWLDPRTQNRESVPKPEKTPVFTDQPSQLKGYSIHTRLSKGPRGFGFNIVGGSRPREFLQVYSVTPGGPAALRTADILVFINDACVLGLSHKEAVEMLKSVPVGQSVDVVLRRGYPMLYNPDGCPKLRVDPPLPAQPGPPPPPDEDPDALLPHHGIPPHLNGNAYCGAPGPGLDANGNAAAPPAPAAAAAPPAAGRQPPPAPPERTTSSQSDGQQRAAMIHNQNNNSVRGPPRQGLEGGAQSAAVPPTAGKHPVPKPADLGGSGAAAATGAGGAGGANTRLAKPPNPLLLPPPAAVSYRDQQQQQQAQPQCGFDGCPGNSISTNGASPGGGAGTGGGLSPGAAGGGGGGGGGELVPVAVGRSEQGMGFSVTAGGQGGRLAVVKRVWDRRQCPSLQPGDAILKINGADVQSLSFAQVQRVLQEHTHQGEVVLLVYRGGSLRSPLSPGIPKRTPHLLQPLAPQNGAPPGGGAALLPSPEGSAPQPGTTGGAPDLAPAATPDLIPSPTSLVQSTSFLDSVPVTLTLEPRDWLSPEEGGRGAAGGQGDWHGALVSRTVEVELRRRAGEGFGFVIASQDAESGRAASLLPHKFIQIRRGSPADRSERIHPGDRLEGINGQSVLSLPHRELAEIFRRAGNTIRLRIVPRSSTNSNLSEPTEVDTESRVRKGHRSRHKDARYYSVDLERGPTGFGFSLRGGSEYNMGLYVLGLMEGGPASRSHKIQVSDQLVEINGDSTGGMTHSQAVDQIRQGGSRIHLVLKRGNGYVPDYGPEFRGQSPSPAVLHKEQGLAAVRDADRPRSSRRSKVKEEQGEQEEDGEKTSGGHGRRGNRGGGRRREEGSLCPETDSLDGALQGKGGRRGQRSPSRDSARIPARDEEGAEPERGRGRESRGERAGGRSWSEGREGRRGQRGEEEQGRKREGEERGKRRGHSLPIPAEGLPSAQALPEPEQRGSPPSPAPAQTGPQAPEREPFSFLLPRAPEAPEPDGARAWGEEGARPSEGRFKPRGTLLPGPWLRPSKEKLLLALDSSQGPGGGGVA
ncbi:membrane-associated guanylate kinase, WW and PDZ domain-containing protein 3-like isoform X2 [Lepisosteus oculatus]